MGANLIVNAVYIRDFMSVVTEAFDGFNTLLNTKRSSSELLKLFHTRFSVAVSKRNSISKSTKLPQFLAAMMLLSNTNIDHSQCVSALDAFALNDTDFLIKQVPMTFSML